MKEFLKRQREKAKIRRNSSAAINQSNEQLLPEHRILSSRKVVFPLLAAADLLFFFLCNYLFQMLVQLPKLSVSGLEPSLIRAFWITPKYWLFYLALLVLIAVFDGVILYRIRVNLKDFNVNQKGSERWATLPEIQQQYREIPEKDKPYPGKPGVPICRYQDKIYIDDSPVNNLIIGMTRSGKGETYVFPTIDIYSRAQEQASMVIVDPKLELAKSSKKTLEERGYEVHILNLTDPSQSMGFNPLQLVIDAYKRGEYAEAELLCSSFCFSIFNPDEGDGDSQFWANNSTALLTALILAHVDDCLRADQELAEEFEQKKKAFLELDAETQQQVREHPEQSQGMYVLPEQTYVPTHENEAKIHMYSIIHTFSVLANYKLNDTTTALDCYFNLREDLDRAKLKYAAIGIAGDKTKGSIFSNTFSKLNVFTYENIAKMTAKNSFDLKDIGFGDKPIAVFLSIPDYDRSNHFIASVFIRQLYFILAKTATKNQSGRCDREVVFLLDEFGNIPAIESMANIITVCLGRNIRFNLIIQAYSQLEQLYGEDSKTIIGNCGNKIYIKTDDLDTAKEFSETLGNRTAINVNRSGKVLSMDKTMTELYEERPLLTPNELMRLRQSECVVKRAMKQRDRNGDLITAYPIFNTGKTAFKYRYDYLTDTFPNPDSIDFASLGVETTKNVKLSVFDTKRYLEETLPQKLREERARKEKAARQAQEPNPSAPPPDEDSSDPLLTELPGFSTIQAAFAQNGFTENLTEMTLGELMERAKEQVQNYAINDDQYFFLTNLLKKEKKQWKEAHDP